MIPTMITLNALELASDTVLYNALSKVEVCKRSHLYDDICVIIHVHVHVLAYRAWYIPI